MLKHTGVRFELLTDIDMIMFIERSICGGLSQFKQVCAANKYMPSYDSSKLSYPYNTNSCRKLSVRLQNHFDLSHFMCNKFERNIAIYHIKCCSRNVSEIVHMNTILQNFQLSYFCNNISYEIVLQTFQLSCF